jgi:phosphocarrier protein
MQYLENTTQNRLTKPKKMGIIGLSKEIKQNKIYCIAVGFAIARVMIGEYYNVCKRRNSSEKVGLHARPATFFIQKANEFKSSIWIEKEERRVNAKSLLGILSLGIVGGTDIKIIADGSDEQSAVTALVDLVNSGFSDDNR